MCAIGWLSQKARSVREGGGEVQHSYKNENGI